MSCAPPSSKRSPDTTLDLSRLDGFDEIIDARSPSEFADDHLPGAINLPVLSDAERAQVGTLHKQVSAFDARKVGAALVARNIADHLQRHLADKPRDYRPLVYCWRGGNRSGSFVTILRAIGWNAVQLEGGYKAFRRHVIDELQRLPPLYNLRVVCGPTGVGKSRLLRALSNCGAQVIDLEELAAHMGSVLGAYPDRPQPSQKQFETRVWRHLSHFDPNQPVFVESESRKIGRLQTPEILLQHMRASPCLNLSAQTSVRVQLLKEEYAHFLADGEALVKQLDCLLALQGRERITAWQALARQGHWDVLVAELLEQHYDPAYSRSLGHNYAQASDGPSYVLTNADPMAFADLAHAILDNSP